MTSHDAAQLRLAALRASTLRRATGLETNFEAIVEAAADVATDDEHDPEGHTIAWERQQIAALRDEANITLNAIDAAEQRIADGSYGSCTICDGDIASNRLEALPATVTCVDCAS